MTTATPEHLLIDRHSNRLLDLVRRGGADQVLVHRLDRLSRSVRNCVTLLDEFRRLEVGLVILTAPELGHSAQDNFGVNIMASFAEFERELIAARIADSRARLKARRLRFAGGVPLGYDTDRRTKQFIPNEGEAAVVRWMFSEAAAGKKPSEIASAANARGYRTKANGGGSCTARQVVSTLRNPVHIGMLKDGRSIRLGIHPAIISNELFKTAGKKLDGAARTGYQPLVSGQVMSIVAIMPVRTKGGYEAVRLPSC